MGEHHPGYLRYADPDCPSSSAEDAMAVKIPAGTQLRSATDDELSSMSNTIRLAYERGMTLVKTKPGAITYYQSVELDPTNVEAYIKRKNK